MNPVDFELALRGGVFLAVFAALALWEHVAPARALRLSRVQRWRANLGLAIVSTLVVRFIVPGSAIAMAFTTTNSGAPGGRTWLQAQSKLERSGS